MAARAFFPTLIYFEKLRASRLEQLNANLRDEAYKLREFDRAGRRWSEDNYAGGYTSYGSMTNLDINKFCLRRPRAGYRQAREAVSEVARMGSPRSISEDVQYLGQHHASRRCIRFTFIRCP